LDKNLITYDEINNINLILNKYIQIDNVITYYNNLLKFKIVDLSKVFENNKVNEYNTLSFNINKFKKNIKIYIEADKKINERDLLNSNKIELSKKELLNKENDFKNKMNFMNDDIYNDNFDKDFNDNDNIEYFNNNFKFRILDKDISKEYQKRLYEMNEPNKEISDEELNKKQEKFNIYMEQEYNKTHNNLTIEQLLEQRNNEIDKPFIIKTQRFIDEDSSSNEY
jgi:hypothetical protein